MNIFLNQELFKDVKSIKSFQVMLSKRKQFKIKMKLVYIV